MKKKLILILLLTAIATRECYAWWSWSPPGEHSTHHMISDAANSLVNTHLTNSTLKSAEWIGFTYLISNDMNAHGNVDDRNGGDIDQLFDAFLVDLNSGDTTAASRNLGYCLHLIADMHVPAHAFNIRHSGIATGTPDQFEYEARNMSPLPVMSVAVPDQLHVLNPTLYYDDALKMTRSSVAASGFAEYYHDGSRRGEYADWNSDGPKGYYTVELGTIFEFLDLDLFPNSSVAGRAFIQKQLNNAVNTTALFLKAVDRLVSYTPTIDQTYSSSTTFQGYIFSGRGFVPSGTARIHTLNSDTGDQTIQSIDVGKLGAFSLNSAIIPPGDYTWWAEDTVNHHRTSPLTFRISASVPVNGACGSSNTALLTTVPTSGLCASGTASAISGNGPWSWDCRSVNGGTTAICSANVLSTAVVATHDGIVIGSGKKGPDIADALAVFQHVQGIVTLSGAELIHADVAPLRSNGTPLGNGVVNMADVIILLRRVIGIGNW